MFSFPIQILPADLAAESAALNAKLAKGVSNLTNLTDADIDIGSTPKDVVFAQDGIEVYHYHALVEQAKEEARVRPLKFWSQYARMTGRTHGDP